MIGRIAVVLLCLGIALAPAAAADSVDDGRCVWTSREGVKVSVGVSLSECLPLGGEWTPSEPG